MPESANQFVQMLLTEAIRVLVPVVLTALAGYVVLLIARLRGEMGESRWAAIVQAVEFAVQAAEQSGLRDKLQQAGQEKKATAIKLAQDWLGSQGITVGVALLEGLIEAAVWRFFNNGRA